MTQRVICVLGPTASGKSEVAQLVAEALGGEVVSADSMQVYQGMDIGTAKLPLAERRVPHHLIDILDPGQPYSAQQFQVAARAVFAELEAAGVVPVLCGGTGLYVQAALEAMDFPGGERADNLVRAAYERRAKEEGPQALWDELQARDAASAALIHPHNVRRVVRALEMADRRVSYAHQVEGMKSLPEVVPSLRFGLQRDPEVLARRIDARVDAMMASGLVDEVKGLLSAGFREALTAPQAIGYKEIVAALDGVVSFDEAVVQIKTATRRYAKRQRSWLRRDSRLQMLDADALDAEALARVIVERSRQTGNM